MNRVEYKDMMVGFMKDLQEKAGDCIKAIEMVQGHENTKDYLRRTYNDMVKVRTLAVTISDIVGIISRAGLVESVRAFDED